MSDTITSLAVATPNARPALTPEVLADFRVLTGGDFDPGAGYIWHAVTPAQRDAAARLVAGGHITADARLVACYDYDPPILSKREESER